MDEENETKKPLRRRARRPAGMRVGLAGLIALVVISGGAGYLGGTLGARSGGTQSVAERRQTALSEEQLVNGIAKDVGPSVVSVNVTSARQTTTTQEDVLEQYFGGGRSQQEGSPQRQSAGTGIIIDSNGTIMTNRHVVPAGGDVSITLSDGTELDDVDIIGRAGENSGLDVAFLKVKDLKGKKLKAAKLADSSKTQVGDRVVAIGNALGQFQNTVTSGIISGYGRSVQAGGGSGESVENLQDLFQTDAAINQGNSGGPLVNANGEVIGINTAIAGDAQSIGFAIPVNDVQGLVRTVLRTGKFEQPYLGVRYQTLTDDAAKQLDLKVTRGAYVLAANEADGEDTVVDSGPADKAGVQPRDIIQAINGTNIDSNKSLSSLLAQYSVGETVELKVLRGGDTQTLRAKLDALPQQ